MTTSGYDAGRDEMREQIIALIYDRYIYHRTFHGKESELALAHKLLIHTIRDEQEKELQKNQETENE
jgi:hypothetical protein